MCGFAGVVVWDDRFRVSRETLGRMSARIAHRGPDGEGLHLSAPGAAEGQPQVALAHRRLAILDPDPRANQPFTDSAGRSIVFNGEIYNFRELRQTLSSEGADHAWRTDCDTEVLLAAYARWGEGCLERLNGMFALAVWDEGDQTLFVARDRMGQKPLYLAYPKDDGAAFALAFASELAALRELPWFDATVDPDHLAHYLRWGYAQSTIYTSAVTQLPPGTWRRFSRGRDSGPQAYFDPNAGDPDASPARPIDAAAIRERVLAAVRRQLISDVPLGCFLSGGMDSSVIAAAATLARAGQPPLMTFSMGFDDPAYDETQFADAVAKHLKTEHRTFVVRPEAAEAASVLTKLAAALGEPFADSSALPTYYLARETRAFVKVALSGDGGDELFGGYDRYRAMAMDRTLSAMPMALRRLAGRFGRGAVFRASPKSIRQRVGRLLRTLDQTAARRYSGYIRIFDAAQMKQLLGAPPLGAPPPPEAYDAFGKDEIETCFTALWRRRDPVQAALATDRLTYLPRDLLTKVDRASMLHALEVRSPFMDPDVVNAAAWLTRPQLLSGGPKRLLREAFAADLPPWVFRRRKMGFAVPIGQWFRQSLRPMLHDTLLARDSFAAAHFNRAAVESLLSEHENKTEDHTARLYALLMLELWRQTSGVT